VRRWVRLDANHRSRPDNRGVKPSAQTLAWVLEAAGAETVVDVGRLSGGWTSAMHAVTLRSGMEEREVVVRRLLREPWRSHAPAMLEREADVLRLLRGSGIPAADCIAVDPHGAHADAPALLMTKLPGRLRLDADRELLAPLARLLVAVHRIDPGGRRPRAYQSWAVPERRVVPSWSTDAGLWSAAFAAIDRDPPGYEGRFLHRDPHLGNVLWTGSTITGVVDWVETSWGPADLDVAHCATGLALLHGADLAPAFSQAYADEGGAISEQYAYWQLLDAIGFLPDPEKVTGIWRACGRSDLTPELARQRLQDLVRATLKTLSRPGAPALPPR
jgi:aminoglycoside phosphotransferase (APT) family kinase protein